MLLRTDPQALLGIDTQALLKINFKIISKLKNLLARTARLKL